MNPAATVLVVLAGGAAVADWTAVARPRPTPRPLEVVAKPLVLLLLAAAAVTLTPVHGAVRWWLVAGLVCSLVGDVALLWPGSFFVVGLGAFLVAHLAYIVAFAQELRSVTGAVIGAVIVAALLVTAGRAVVTAVRRDHPPLTGPVVAYMGALGAMVVVGCASGRLLAGAGAVAFLVSDTVLAWDRFVRPFAAGKLATHVTYHLGQAGLVLALAR